MTILNSASVASTATLNVITTSAHAVDNVAGSIYDATDVLRTRTKLWASDAKDDAVLHTMQSTLFRRDDMATDWALRAKAIQDKLGNDDELRADFEKYRAQINVALDLESESDPDPDEDS